MQAASARPEARVAKRFCAGREANFERLCAPARRRESVSRTTEAKTLRHPRRRPGAHPKRQIVLTAFIFYFEPQRAQRTQRTATENCGFLWFSVSSVVQYIQLKGITVRRRNAGKCGDTIHISQTAGNMYHVPVFPRIPYVWPYSSTGCSGARPFSAHISR